MLLYLYTNQHKVKSENLLMLSGTLFIIIAEGHVDWLLLASIDCRFSVESHMLRIYL